MSYIKPSDYTKIANLMGEAFATLYGAYNDPTADVSETYPGTTTGYSISQEIIKTISASDDSVSNSLTKDPLGSIANDLGASAYSLNSKFSLSSAKSSAANEFSQILSALNNHVVSRSPETVSTISEYYAKYNSGDGNFEDNLFSDNTDPDYYFSQDFVDLCGALNITMVNSSTQLVGSDGKIILST